MPRRPLARHCPTSSTRSAHGIHAIDTGFHRPRFDAAYLIVEHGRAAFVDTGTNHSVPRLLAALGRARPRRRTRSTSSSPTHVHLDHAGGVGLLMQQLPNGAARGASASARGT